MSYLDKLPQKFLDFCHQNNIRLSYTELDKESRKTIFTGTDAPILLGSSPYTTLPQRFAEKLGLVPEFEGNDATEEGEQMEPLLLSRMLMRDLPQLMEVYDGETLEVRFNALVKNDIIGATLDVLVLHWPPKDAEPVAVLSGEAKFTKQYWGDRIPEHIMDQCCHQQLCVHTMLQVLPDGCPHVLVFRDSTGFTKFEDLDRNLDREEAILELATYYHPMLLKGEIPVMADEPKEVAAKKVKGKSPEQAMTEEQLAQEERMLGLQAWLKQHEPTFKNVSAEVESIKQGLGEGLPMGVILVGQGRLYRTQRANPSKVKWEKVAADLAAFVKAHPEATSEDILEQRDRLVRIHTTAGYVSKSVTYRGPNGEADDTTPNEEE